MSGNTGATQYLRTETDDGQNASPSPSAFAEHRPTRRTSVTLGVDNPGSQANRRQRNFHEPDGTSRTPARQDYRGRNGHRTICFPVKHSFG